MIWLHNYDQLENSKENLKHPFFPPFLLTSSNQHINDSAPRIQKIRSRTATPHRWLRWNRRRRVRLVWLVWRIGVVLGGASQERVLPLTQKKKHLVGGFKYVYVHPYLGKIPILTNIFQMGWNHQPAMVFVYFVVFQLRILGDYDYNL